MQTEAFDPIAFARSSAAIAVDQQQADRPGETVADYRDNVIDTCHEHGVDDCTDALRTFDALVADLQRDPTLSSNARQVARRMARAARKARGF